MNSRDALAALRTLAVPALTTSDAAAALGMQRGAASQALGRLSRSGLVVALRHGLWALAPAPEPLALAEYMSAPYPAYVSLQSALYLRGMISQIPDMTYVVTLGRAGRVQTPVGTFSLHHVDPALFGGFEHQLPSGVKLAFPEKALVDFLYLSPTRSRLFGALPELQLPRGFQRRRARAWVQAIPAARLRTIAQARLEEIFRHQRPSP